MSGMVNKCSSILLKIFHWMKRATTIQSPLFCILPGDWYQKNLRQPILWKLAKIWLNQQRHWSLLPGRPLLPPPRIYADRHRDLTYGDERCYRPDMVTLGFHDIHTVEWRENFEWSTLWRFAQYISHYLPWKRLYYVCDLLNMINQKKYLYPSAKWRM